MSTATMTERTGYSGVGVSGFPTPQFTTPTGVSAGTNWMMIPRCTFKVEKCTGGFKVVCHCDDKLAGSMVQNLCAMLAGGMCSWCVVFNGLTVCSFTPTMGLCKFENVENGVCVTCTSGDPTYCSMLQAYCDCLCCAGGAGCTCCFLVNNTPVCCGPTEVCSTSPKAKTGK
ncbi:MAG: hypothetical protein L0Z62_44100 [Gemmataceae bacterium]|nr:hypothetical protein [Gemmataceae bacterium]